MGRATARTKLLSVTHADCKMDIFRCPGAGGQKVNKTSSGVRYTHEPSGAVGESCEQRSQDQNRKTAFRRMAETQAFKAWVNVEAMRRSGELKRVQDKVNEQLLNETIVEVEVDNEWTAAPQLAINKYDIKDLR